MSICIRYTRNQDKAKEVLNLGFYKILTSLNKYDQQSPIKPWIRKIMINTLINEFKKEKLHHQNVMYVDTYFEEESYSELNECISRSNAQELYNIIAQLAPASRHVFNLYFIDGYKHKEIADMLGITEGTSKWHLNSAREKLKELLQTKELIVKSNNHE